MAWEKAPQRHASPIRKGAFAFSAGRSSLEEKFRGEAARLRLAFQPGAHFLRRRQFAGIFGVEGDALEVVADAEAHEAVAGELGAGHAAALLVVEAIGPGEELIGNAFGGAVAVRFAFGEEMPDDDEETVSDDDDGIVGVFAAGEFLETALPEGMAADGAPGDLDHSPAEVFAAFFGDGFGAFLDAALMDAGSDAGVTDEVL